jgi:hypothetical protein
MKNPDESIDTGQLQSLRESIKEKYKQYQLTDRDRFPSIAYNTNRNNYEPLRISIEEELFTVRGIEKSTDHFQVPSISSLANLFTNDRYVPSKKLLNTYQLYAESNANAVSRSETPGLPKSSTGWIIKISGAILVAAVTILLVLYLWPLAGTSPSNLYITRPKTKALVPWELVVEGHVTDAETVWLVVRYEKGIHYYVQPQVTVQKGGRWLGVVYIGSDNSHQEGLKFQIRALVNPVEKLTNEEIYYDWPEAELTSELVEVVRK